MKINKFFENNRQSFSLEIFPPKKEADFKNIDALLDELEASHPDFISVTYGAGGNTADRKTCQIAAKIKEKHHILPVAHLTCVSTSKEDADIILQDFKDNGIENILALRGDINPDRPPKKDFLHATDLVKYIHQFGGFDVSGACYPEGHMEAPNMIEDIKHLKEKVDAGAEHLISQLFFDNQAFYDFREKARIAGINVPIEAGIMPVTSKSQIERMVSMCGASLPAKFAHTMQRYADNKEALRDAGIAYACEQIVDLLSNGVDGIHLYSMNNPYIARKIWESTGKLFHGRNN